MKLLYFECNMGAAGDMLTAALYELLSDEQRQRFLEIMNGLFEDVSVRALPAQTKGICGTRMEVLVGGAEEEAFHPGHDVPREEEHQRHHDEDDGAHRHPHAHVHTSPEQIRERIEGLAVRDAVKAHVQAVYDDIAAAESHVHGVPVTQIHFHEVGSLDAAADITGVALALDLLGPDRIVTSPVHLGSGEVHCAHGVLPVPAPATADLLRGVPCYTGEIRGELCTPTGAALLKHFSDAFGPMPVMIPEKTGYGIGKREFPAANCVRAFLGETQTEGSDIGPMPQTAQAVSGGILQDTVIELCSNIDDMTPEELSFAAERLMEMGALDVTSAPVTMKKGRSGIQFTVLCRPQDEEKFAQAVLRETCTNGVRVRRCGRYLLQPEYRTVETAYGPVRVKHVQGGGICREKPEYEDLARIARETGLPLHQVRSQTEKGTGIHGG